MVFNVWRLVLALRTVVVFGLVFTPFLPPCLPFHLPCFLWATERTGNQPHTSREGGRKEGGERGERGERSEGGRGRSRKGGGGGRKEGGGRREDRQRLIGGASSSRKAGDAHPYTIQCARRLKFAQAPRKAHHPRPLWTGQIERWTGEIERAPRV